MDFEEQYRKQQRNVKKKKNRMVLTMIAVVIASILNIILDFTEALKYVDFAFQLLIALLGIVVVFKNRITGLSENELNELHDKLQDARRVTTAMQMRNENINPKVISRITGMSLSEIEGL